MKKLLLGLMTSLLIMGNVFAADRQVKSLAPGERVLVYWTNKYYYPAKLISYNEGTGTVNVDFFTGELVKTNEANIFHDIWDQGYKIEFKQNADSNFEAGEIISVGTDDVKVKNSAGKEFTILNRYLKTLDYYQNKKLQDNYITGMIDELSKNRRFEDAIWLANQRYKFAIEFSKGSQTDINKLVMADAIALLAQAYYRKGDYDKVQSLWEAFKPNITGMMGRFNTYYFVQAAYRKAMNLYTFQNDVTGALNQLKLGEMYYNASKYMPEDIFKEPSIYSPDMSYLIKALNLKRENKQKPEAKLTIGFFIYKNMVQEHVITFLSPNYPRQFVPIYDSDTEKSIQVNQAELGLYYFYLSRGRLGISYKNILVEDKIPVQSKYLFTYSPEHQKILSKYIDPKDYAIAVHTLGYMKDAEAQGKATSTDNWILMDIHNETVWTMTHELFHSIEITLNGTPFSPVHPWLNGNHSQSGWTGKTIDEMGFYDYIFNNQIEKMVKSLGTNGYKILFEDKFKDKNFVLSKSKELGLFK